MSIANLFKVGNAFPFPWPKTNNFYSPKSFDLMKELFNKNKDDWLVSEKYHGCNSCITSNGFFCSRNKVAFESKQKEQEDKLLKSKLNIHGLPPTHIWPLFDKVKYLKEQLKPWLPKKEVEVLLFGEFIVEGTATCPHDIYNYQLSSRARPGHFYAFGLGFLVADYCQGDFDTFEEMFGQKVVSYISQDENKEPYFICPMNDMLRDYITDECDIPSIPILYKDSLKNILKNKDLIENLENRDCEGFIFHNSDSLLFKWKHPEERPNDYQLENIALLEKTFSEYPEIVESLLIVSESVNDYVESFNEKDIHTFLETLVNLNHFKMKNDLNCSYSCSSEKAEEAFLRRWKCHLYNYFADYLSEENRLKLGNKISMQVESIVKDRIKKFIKNAKPVVYQ